MDPVGIIDTILEPIWPESERRRDIERLVPLVFAKLFPKLARNYKLVLTYKSKRYRTVRLGRAVYSFAYPHELLNAGGQAAFDYVLCSAPRAYRACVAPISVILGAAVFGVHTDEPIARAFLGIKYTGPTLAPLQNPRNIAIHLLNSSWEDLQAGDWPALALLIASLPTDPPGEAELLSASANVTSLVKRGSTTS